MTCLMGPFDVDGAVRRNAGVVQFLVAIGSVPEHFGGEGLQLRFVRHVDELHSARLNPRPVLR